MDPDEELFPEDASQKAESSGSPPVSQEDKNKLAAPITDQGARLSRKENLMRSLAESLEASTAAPAAPAATGASSLRALAAKYEEEAGDDDGIGELPQSLFSKRLVSPDVESLLGRGVEDVRESFSEASGFSASSPIDFLMRQVSPGPESPDFPKDWDEPLGRSSEPLGSRSSSKESGISRAAESRTKSSKELLTKGSTASLLGGSRVHRLDRDELKRLGQEIKDIHSTYKDKFVGKMDYFSLLSRMARIEEFMENQLGRGGSVTSVIEILTRESRIHMKENEKLHRQIEELGKATVGNTSRIRDESHRVENAADHAFRTAKHLEEVSCDFSVTKEAFREDVSRMAKAVQVLATEFSIFEEENQKSDKRKAEQIGTAGDAIRELQKQIGKQELHGSSMEDGLEVVKQEVDTCAKEVGLKKLERRIMDMQEESARLQEFVHEKFFQIQDQERREMMAAFAARWDPYNRTRLFRKTFDGWVEFLRRQNKAREALGRVKQIYAKTHVTARLRSWWYLMQRDHTDTQFKRLSENLETAEAKLEGTRGAVIRHEKATAEQARNLQYRLLAVEKGLETAEKEKATKEELEESFGEIDRRLTEELSLDPVRRDLAEIKMQLKKVQEEKLDVAVADADREKVNDFCSEFRSWLMRHEETLKRKADITENNTKADAKTIEQVLVLLAKQADQLASMVAHDFDQLRQALTRFLEISPDFRKASLAVGFEPHEQCVACRALPRKCVSDGATGTDGTIYKLSMETAISAVEETQKVLADKLRYPLCLATNPFVGCMSSPGNVAQDTDAVSDVQPLPLLRHMVLAEAGWLAGKESLQDRMAPRKLVAEEVLVHRAATPKTKRRPPSAQDSARERPQSVRSYFPAVNPKGSAGSGWKSRD